MALSRDYASAWCSSVCLSGCMAWPRGVVSQGRVTLELRRGGQSRTTKDIANDWTVDEVVATLRGLELPHMSRTISSRAARPASRTEVPPRSTTPPFRPLGFER